MRFLARALVPLALLALVPGVAVAHELFDHQAPALGPQPNPVQQAQSGPATAKWEFVESIATGNPHSDVDFFRRGGNIYASAGTLGVAPNGGGQTIVQLTNGDAVEPKLVSQAPTASCIANEAAALGLQHDVEASPKGGTILNTFNPFAAEGDAQVIVDATDAQGRCHDQERFGGISQVGLADKRGGLEIIDVTDPAKPVEIGLTSHIGEAHTVNVDPKRPHIAYAVTSDSVSVDEAGKRANETSGFGLDGFEVVDMSSCMNFPAGTSVEAKRAACRPQVFRYRYPQLSMVQGHSNKSSIYGCHELEVYPDDRLTCASGSALIVLDMAGAFDDRGTPDDFTDDKPRGTPLPCTVRDSASQAFATGAKVTDCVDGAGAGTDDLIVSKWLGSGAPSLNGVRYLGSSFHMGRESSTGAFQPAFDSTQDIDFDHEAELSHSGNLLIATDERGGGVTPPGASCSSASDNKTGNGGLHFYRANALQQGTPATPDAAFGSYAQLPGGGGKAIYRAPVRTGGQATVCTAHVFQQIPGQNRIFMGWYSQGTQVVDFTENPDGTVTLKEAGYFIPANANEWVSHVFKAQENPDGTFTYWGAAADFNLGERGRNSIDVWRVTLPAPPKPADGPGVIGRRVGGRAVSPSEGAPSCVSTPVIRSATARRRRTGLALGFRATAPVTVDLFRQSAGRRVLGERLVKRFRSARGSLRWNGRDRRGRRLSDGYYVARFSARSGGVSDVRRIALVKRRGRFSVAPAYARRDQCGTLRSFKLERPVFGGRSNRALNVAFRLGSAARASIEVRRGSRVVRRFGATEYAGGRVHRKRISVTRRLPRGRYRVTITVTDAGRRVSSTLQAVRL
jgi:hypothetical protein